MERLRLKVRKQKVGETENLNRKWERRWEKEGEERNVNGKGRKIYVKRNEMMKMGRRHEVIGIYEYSNYPL